MKRTRSIDAASETATSEDRRRASRIVKGAEVGLPNIAEVVLEEDVVEVKGTEALVLVRFPCFDFFENVSLCE